MGQFSGIKVLELASVLAGPGVGQFFAELGAEVIKVENLRTGGDVTRTWKSSGEKTDDRSAYFCSVNWGKKSVSIDLAQSEGQTIVQKLAAQCDIVIASYKPGDAEKLRVDYQTLSKINPSIIYGQVTGYGSSNPRVGYDAIIQAEAGFMFMNGELGAASLKMPVALMDVLAGHHLKEGLLLAMLEKTQTGKGKLVEVSLIKSALASLVNQATNWLVNNKLPQKQGSAHPNIAPYGELFKTIDDKEVMLAVGSDRQFIDLCKVLKLNHVSEHGDYKTNSLRVVNRKILAQKLAEQIVKMNSETLMKELQAFNVPAGVVQNMEQAFSMNESRDIIFEKDGIRGVKSVVFEPVPSTASDFLPPPHFGEHTESVLSDVLQISAEKILSLRKSGVIN